MRALGLPVPHFADKVRKNRVLVIVSPDSKIPPEVVQKFFDGLSQKNNLYVLTGEKTAMGSVEKAARQVIAESEPDDEGKVRLRINPAVSVRISTSILLTH